jgi:hypothetical protein
LGGQVFALEAIDGHDKLYTPDELYQGILEAIISAQSNGRKHSLGLFTTTDRDTWAKVSSPVFLPI